MYYLKESGGDLKRAVRMYGKPSLSPVYSCYMANNAQRQSKSCVCHVCLMMNCCVLMLACMFRRGGQDVGAQAIGWY